MSARLRTAGAIIALVALLGFDLQPVSGAAAAWPVGVGAVNAGEARSAVAPATPTSVAAACTNPLISSTVTVSWTLVAGVTSYVILQATAASTGPYVMVGSSSTASWTSGALGTGSYWYEVRSVVGSLWLSAPSAPTAKRTVAISLLCA